MEIVQIFQAERLSRASSSGDKIFYLVFREIGDPKEIQLTNIENKLEKIVGLVLERSINIQFPEIGGIIHHPESNTHYRYNKVDKKYIDQIANQLRNYLS